MYKVIIFKQVQNGNQKTDEKVFEMTVEPSTAYLVGEIAHVIVDHMGSATRVAETTNKDNS